MRIGPLAALNIIENIFEAMGRNEYDAKSDAIGSRDNGNQKRVVQIFGELLNFRFQVPQEAAPMTVIQGKTARVEIALVSTRTTRES